jgi:Uma2 family endonuclease
MVAVKEKAATIKEYRELPQGSPYQLIEGDLVMTPAPTPRHQRISSRLYKRIEAFVDKNSAGSLYYSPIDIYLEEANAYQPDLVFISKERQEIIKEDAIYGAPDLVVEILSPSTAYYDLRKKFRVYERCGVKEYWIVDPEMLSIEIYRNEKGRFVQTARAEGEGEVESAVLQSLKVAAADIFQMP